jgi:hypothetical protein
MSREAVPSWLSGPTLQYRRLFELQFAPNTLLAKRCKIVWQHARIFGIQFC